MNHPFKTKIEMAQYECSFHTKYENKKVIKVEMSTNHELESFVYFDDGTHERWSGLITSLLKELE